MKRKRVKPKAGDVFAVPLFDGTYGLGHVVAHEYDAICALFAKRASHPEELLKDLDDALARPVAILVLTDGELRSGEWPVITYRAPVYPPEWIPKVYVEGAVSHTATAGPAFLAAYHGLIPWDGMADPKNYEAKLLPGVAVPSTVRYKRDFPRPLGTAPAPPSEPPPPITEGPAEIHIQILYPGTELPTIDQLRARQELERRIEAEGAGEVTDAGGGEGVMDVYLETDDIQRAMPIVERVVGELGLAADTLIEVGPIEDEEDGEDDDDEA